MVARPRIVRGAIYIYNIVCRPLRQLLFQMSAHRFRVGRNNQEQLTRGNFVGQTLIKRRDFGQHIGPIGIGVGPSELHAALWKPFRCQHTLVAPDRMLHFLPAQEVFQF